ncbi:MAG: AraC family transcriptional regulator [Burkholderiales bacterium]
MDVLSDVLRAVRLTGAIYFDVNARAPWIAETPPVSSICARVMPECDHVISFHIMLDGACWAQLGDESQPAIRLEAGDAVIFPRGDGHFMSTEIGKRSTPDLSLYYRPNDRPLPFVLSELGGSGERSRFVCGYLGCDARPFNPLLDALPRKLHVRSSSAGGQLVHDLIRHALQETESPSAGGETILSKLSELMFLQAVRQQIDALPPESTGWLAALRDRNVGAALRLMHGRPAEPWTLDSLAREVGLSRSVFAERFSQLMVAPAMHYLSNWRLQVAASLLKQDRLSIAQVAAEVGYESEAAFNRAFKKQVGVPPGAWRRGLRPSQAGDVLTHNSNALPA